MWSSTWTMRVEIIFQHPVVELWKMFDHLENVRFYFCSVYFRNILIKCKCVLYFHYIDVTSHMKSLELYTKSVMCKAFPFHNVMCAEGAGDHNVTQPIRFLSMVSQGHDGFPPNPFWTVHRPNKHRPLFGSHGQPCGRPYPHNTKCWVINRSNYS